MLLEDTIEEFLLELDIKGASKETIRSYENSLKVFKEYMCDNTNLDNIKTIHIKEFAKFNKDRGLKQKTQNGYIYKSLAKELLRCINEDGEKALITYGEMCSRANDIIDPIGSSVYRGNLSEICCDNDMTLISVMVVNANTYSPGGGFFRLYTQLTGKEVEDEPSLFKEELKKVREYGNWDRLAALLNLDIEIKKSNPKKNSTPNNSTKLTKKSYEEGKLRLKTHTERERNPKVVKDAKRLFLNENKRVYCELCGFDFEKVYGELGKNFIEGHHIKPISEMKDGDITNVEDIKMLCSNCHRMVHMGIERGIDLEGISNLINKM